MSYNAFKERLEKDKIANGLFIEMDVLKDDEWQEQARSVAHSNKKSFFSLSNKQSYFYVHLTFGWQVEASTT